jgi:acetyl esterase/lipase
MFRHCCLYSIRLLSLTMLALAMESSLFALVLQDEAIQVWPDLAPAESTRSIGEKLPNPPNENPIITRVVNITSPTMSVHRPKQPNGTAVVILPGGGFGRVVPDLEGTEAATWLNEHGITAFVLHYRTTDPKSSTPGWGKPIQDAQRALSLIRSQADRWKILPNKLGIVGFSAGGQATARLLALEEKKSYDKIDDIDMVAHRPDFAVLIYPWNMYDAKQDRLVEGIQVPPTCPPTFLVHTHDDKSSALGAVHFYAGLKKLDIPAELHVYGNGGHGYGLRPVKGSEISSWPGHAAHWLKTQGFVP